MHESQKSRYPQKDGRFGLEELQWIQYQLDTAAPTAADVAASDGRIRVSDNSVAPLHFLVADADAKGDTAVIEYLAGKMTCYLVCCGPAPGRLRQQPLRGLPGLRPEPGQWRPGADLKRQRPHLERKPLRPGGMAGRVLC